MSQVYEEKNKDSQENKSHLPNCKKKKKRLTPLHTYAPEYDTVDLHMFKD